MDLLDYIVNYIVLISRNQLRQGSKSGVFFPQPTITRLATKTIPGGAPLPTEHSKNYDISWNNY